MNHWVRTRYLKFYDRLVPVHGVVVVIVVALTVMATLLIPRLNVDMSFRPLFAEDPAVAQATAEFEAEFGQPSGAWLVAILENKAVLSQGFMQAVGDLSDRVASIEHVVEVVSAPRLVHSTFKGGVTQLYSLLPTVGDKFEPGSLQGLPSNPLARAVVAADGNRTLLLARLDLPLADLAKRRAVIDEFQRVVTAGIPADTRVMFTGVSVVEAAYADLVLQYLVMGVALIVLLALVIAWLTTRDVGAVIVIFSGVTVATPITLALMHIFGQSITIVNSMVSTMVLVIGLADAIHMLGSFHEHHSIHTSRCKAVRGMFAAMAVPCLATTLTTMAGFLALQAAKIQAISDFGVNVAIGVAVVYVANQLLIPYLLTKIKARPHDEPFLGESGETLIKWATQIVCRRPLQILWITFFVIVGSGIVLTRLSVDQKFNEELGDHHEVQMAQQIFEQDFGGFLGPELVIERRDGEAMTRSDDWLRLIRLRDELKEDVDVARVHSVFDLVPAAIEADDIANSLMALRDSALSKQIGERINEGGTRLAFLIRVPDIGTARAKVLVERVEEKAHVVLGPAYRTEIVGQWWLAQKGMDGLMGDMVATFSMAFLLILPFMAIAVRSWALLLISILPNLFPLAITLSFMVLADIGIRISTAMVLAIALGIAVDDSLHVLVRYRHEIEAGRSPREALERCLQHTGKALVVTTLVLVMGFASMLVNPLLAIRDMGIVAGVAMTAALVADLLILPALLWICRTLALPQKTRLIGPTGSEQPRPTG